MRRGRAVVAACAVLLVGACGGDGIDRGEVEQLLRDQGAKEVASDLTDSAVTLITAMCAEDKPASESDIAIKEVLDEGIPRRFVTNAIHKFCPERESALGLVNIARSGS
jgi:hypothetical protein